jgi:hypothetical protein
MFLGLQDPDPSDREVRIRIWLRINTKFWQKVKFLRLKITCLWVSYKEKYGKKLILFATVKSLKKGIGSGVDPDPLVRGADTRIRIRTKMSRIPNNSANIRKKIRVKRPSNANKVIYSRYLSVFPLLFPLQQQTQQQQQQLQQRCDRNQKSQQEREGQARGR